MEDLFKRLQTLKEVINLPEKKKKVEELELEVSKPDLWSDPETARRTTQELSDIKKEIREGTF